MPVSYLYTWYKTDRNGSPQPMFFSAFRQPSPEGAQEILTPSTRTMEEFEIVSKEFHITTRPSIASEDVDEVTRTEETRDETVTMVIDEPREPEKNIVEPGFDEQPRPQVTLTIEVPSKETDKGTSV